MNLFKPSLAALSLLLAAAAQAAPLPELGADALRPLNQQQAARTAQAAAWLGAHAPALGLAPGDAFVLRHTTTNKQGECVARFDQLHQGARVEGATAVVKLAPDGTATLASSSLAPGLAVAAAPGQLDRDGALDLLTARLQPTGGWARLPVAEPIVFPTAAAGEVVLAASGATGLLGLDPLRSADLFAPRAPFVRAFRVTGELVSSGDGPDLGFTAVLDATTGAILERSVSGEAADPFLYASGLPVGPRVHAKARSAAESIAFRPRSSLEAGGTFGQPTTTLTPALGYANTYYVGAVVIPTTYDPVLKGYGLLDTTRGGAANYFVQDKMGAKDSYGNYTPNTARPAGNLVVAADGLNVFVPYTMDGLVGSLTQVVTDDYPTPRSVSSTLVTGAPATTGDPFKDNRWGDGTTWTASGDSTMAQGVFGPSGQTAAADALNTITCAYELLKYEFNRLGVDGTDAAVTAFVNSRNYHATIGWQTRATRYDAATQTSYTVPYQVIACGAGDSAAGLLSTAEPTLLGMALGNMLWESVVGYSGSGTITDYRNVQRAFSNLFSQAVYSLGSLHGLGKRSVIPDWLIGENWAGGGASTAMYKPSLDGISPDAWYDGSFFIGNSSPQYAAGPMNRAYFFMAMGASANPASSSHSLYLPEGFGGIGIEKTFKIAYKALTEDLPTWAVSGAAMRAALLVAAAGLYGEGSAEVIATANAWGAVNIGPGWGKPEPVRIWFDAKNWPDNSDLGAKGPFEPNPRAERYPWVPAGEPALLKANVTGTSDTSVTFTADPAPYSGSGFYDLSRPQNGQITAEGLYLSPLRQPTGSINVCSVQAHSKADPLQSAQGMVYALAFDMDGDGNNDALDVGMVALAYGLPFEILLEVNQNIFMGFPGVSEGEVQMTLAAFTTAFGN